MTPFNTHSKAVLVLAVTLLAFVVESQLTQYVQTVFGYRKPYFIFWIVHSSFVISLPCHLALLALTTGQSLPLLRNGLASAISHHLNSDGRSFPLSKCLALACKLTAAVTFPALLWFSALEMSSVTDVTAIWNTNAFFAYLFSVKIFGLKWQVRKLAAVVLATFGVLAVVYGGSTVSSGSPSAQSMPKSSVLFGDLITLVASVGYAAYQVYYKLRAALPSNLEFNQDYRPLSASENPDSRQQDSIPSLPFGLYSNFWTFAIGACTFLFLWIPLPILHWFGVEPFALPGSWSIAFAIAGIALSGAIFNAGFNNLLVLWGPIITSVGGLLTIVLVFFSDILLGATDSLTPWGVGGSAIIVIAFGVLAYDMLQPE